MFRRYMWMVVTVLPACSLFGLLTGALIAYVLPKHYESQTILHVKPPRAAATPGAMATAEFLAKQLDDIKSRSRLERVTKELELTSRWNLDKETCIAVLREIIEPPTFIRGSDLLSIRVRHTNKVDARDIANAVAEVHQSMRDEVEKVASARMLEELGAAVRSQEQRVEEKRRNLTQFLGVEDRNLDPSLAPKADVRDAYIRAKNEFESEQKQLADMKLRQIGETIQSKLPGSSIEIHEYATVSPTPVSPNIILTLVTGTAGGLILSFPLAMVLVFLLPRNGASKGS